MKKMIKDFLNVKLQDNETSFGGVSFENETVRDFIQETNLSPNDTLDKLNKELISCGIKEIKKGGY